MELRKNPSIDLERKRGMFFSIGLLVSMLLVLSAFEWRTKVVPSIPDLPDVEPDFVLLYEPVVTEIDIPVKPEIPKKVIINPIIKIVKDDEILVAIEKEVTDISLPFDELGIGELEDPEPVIEGPFDVVEKMPEPYGGMTSFMKFIGENIKYPRRAKYNGVEGRVYAKFVIDEEGNITQLHIIKGIGSGCDEEALRVIGLAPAWQPGKQRGRPVKVRMVVPVHFQLN